MCIYIHSSLCQTFDRHEIFSFHLAEITVVSHTFTFQNKNKKKTKKKGPTTWQQKMSRKRNPLPFTRVTTLSVIGCSCGPRSAWRRGHTTENDARGGPNQPVNFLGWCDTNNRLSCGPPCHHHWNLRQLGTFT